MAHIDPSRVLTARLASVCDDRLDLSSSIVDDNALTTGGLHKLGRQSDHIIKLRNVSTAPRVRIPLGIVGGPSVSSNCVSWDVMMVFVFEEG